MDNIMKYSANLESFIEGVIFKYCPYMEDRLHILGNAQSPQIDIEISIDNNQSQVRFLFGNSNFKQSIPEQAIIKKVVEFEKIGNIIDFILQDHEIIKDINIYKNRVNLKFAINWTEKSIKGINCGDIELSLIFNNAELEKQYLYLLFQKYYIYLEQASSFKIIKNKYIDDIKKSYFNVLDKIQLLTLLNQMNETELKELLYSLDNNTFIKYTTEREQHPQIKKLTLGESKD